MSRAFNTLLLLSLLCLAAQAEPVLPEPLAHLSEHLKDANAFADALRAYDLQQQDLAFAVMAEAGDLRKQGKNEEAKAKYEEAIEIMKPVLEGYRIGLEHFPNNGRLHSYYGEVLYDIMGNEVQAVVHWQKAVSFDKNVSGAHNNLGLHYMHIGKYELGLSHMETALKLEKDNPDYLFNMAQVYLIHWPQIMKMKGYREKKIYREAMKMSQRAAELVPTDYKLSEDYAVNFFAAERFGEVADWKKAAKAWEQARALAGNDDQRFYTWLNEARVWIEAGDKERTIACLNEALTIRPQSDVATRLLEQARAQ